jgi:hypothetical protein
MPPPTTATRCFFIPGGETVTAPAGERRWQPWIVLGRVEDANRDAGQRSVLFLGSRLSTIGGAFADHPGAIGSKQYRRSIGFKGLAVAEGGAW